MRILVTGSQGQIGSELTLALRERYGADNVIGLDIQEEKNGGPYHKVDVCDSNAVENVIKKHRIDAIYHLVGILSAKGEQIPSLAWTINVGGLKVILDLAVKHKIKKVFWPSSIAAFGPSAKKKGTPQDSFLDPNTMYGVSKVAGELLCNYYFKRWHLDVRSLRYPGIISYKAPPGGGTTDYAIEIFHKALKKQPFSCFLKKDAMLPMMYMDDAVRASIEIMKAPARDIKVRTSYNLAAISFSPAQIAKAIKRYRPELEVSYDPDATKQLIAESWPQLIDDSEARKDWGWKHEFDLNGIVRGMLTNLRV